MFFLASTSGPSASFCTCLLLFYNTRVLYALVHNVFFAGRRGRARSKGCEKVFQRVSGFDVCWVVIVLLFRARARGTEEEAKSSRSECMISFRSFRRWPLVPLGVGGNEAAAVVVIVLALVVVVASPSVSWSVERSRLPKSQKLQSLTSSSSIGL